MADIDQLTELVGKAQPEMASRERQRRKDLRGELERRVAAAGDKMGASSWRWTMVPRAESRVERCPRMKASFS